MSADRFREAAALLRERAGGETPGPWTVVEGNDSTDWPVMGSGDYLCVSPDDGVRGGHSEADAAYIAMMHPAVALALADWLDVAGADEWAHGPHCLTPCDDCDDDPRAPHIRSALAVADAILGGER